MRPFASGSATSAPLRSEALTDTLQPALAPELAALVAAARSAADTAYAPYSGFHVGAALRASDGRVFVAANVENASYGLSLCAEANAVAAAAVAGVREIVAVAVVGYPSREATRTTLATPCGRCRQMIAEFAGRESMIVVESHDASVTLVLSLEQLLPHSFGRNRMTATTPRSTEGT